MRAHECPLGMVPLSRRSTGLVSPNLPQRLQYGPSALIRMLVNHCSKLQIILAVHRCDIIGHLMFAMRQLSRKRVGGGVGSGQPSCDEGLIPLEIALCEGYKNPARVLHTVRYSVNYQGATMTSDTSEKTLASLSVADGTLSTVQTYMNIPDTLADWPWPRQFNPHTEEATSESNIWFKSLGIYSPRSQQAWERGRYGLLGGLAWPDVSKGEPLRQHESCGCTGSPTS